MINYNLPGFYDHFLLNKFFIELYNKNPEVFLPGVKISSVYGNFPFTSWDGGRCFNHYKQLNKEAIIEIYSFYHMHNIPLRFIFTNPELKEEHLYNRFENLILKICDNGNNEVCLNSPILEEYIRTNYPSYKIISSTTKCLKLEDLKNELKKDYYQICLDYNLNKNIQFLDSLTAEEKNKSEFLVNAICPPGCKFRKQHYSENGKTLLSFNDYDYRWKMDGNCGISQTINHPTVLGKRNNLSIEEVIEYSKKGFSNFKLEGRTLDDCIMATNYIYYMIKPEWYFFVTESVYKFLFENIELLTFPK